MNPKPYCLSLLLALAAALPTQAADIDIPDHSFAPDGSTTSAYQQTDISTPNGGNVLPAGSSSQIAYFITTFTFGAASNAHLQANFRATNGVARVGIEINDDGLVQFVGSNDTTKTSFNLNQDMAGKSVVFIVKAHYDPNHNVTYGKANASDDTLFNVWVNPTDSSTEGSGQSAGNMHTIWNSATFGFLGQTIQNQSTPGTAGTSFITDTVVLTGADATFTNAVALATGATPPTGIVDPATSTVSASPLAVPADGTTTSTVTVTLKDAGGSPVAGKEISLSSNGTAMIATGNNISSASGVVNFIVKSGNVGTEIFTATDVTDNNLVITQTASVDFTDPQDANAFNVNFLATNQTAATGLLGVVGGLGETWNQGMQSVSNLVDTTGTVTSAVNVSGLPESGTPITANLAVFKGNRNFFGKGQDTTINITGLTPNTAYDIYIYALSHNTASLGNNIDTERAAGDFVTTNTVLGNGQSQWLDNGKAGTNGDSFLPNGNYVTFQSIATNASGNISILADAHDGIDGLANTNDGNCRLHICGLQIRPASGMSVDYMKWRASNHPGLGLPDVDDDGDGYTNDYERIFGMNPTDSSSVNPYPDTIDPASGYFSYTRRTRSLVNMDYKVLYSTDLVEWFEDNAANQLVESVMNGTEIMGVEVDPALLVEPKLFIQVKAAPITGIDNEPKLLNVWGSGNTITVLFSEPMNPSAANNPGNYSVGQDGVGALNITDATLSEDGGSVTLTLASTLGIDTGYTVGMERLTSGTGQALGTGISRQFKTWDNDPNGIKVFILAGQSNMVGYGNVETGATGAGTIGSLRYLVVNDASFPDYEYASLLTNPALPESSAFKTRSDVKVWWRNGPQGNFNLGGAISKGDLGPPYKGADSGKIGPEFAFGQVIGDFYPDHDVLIIKCSWGGRDLAEKFRGPSAVAKRGGQVGEFFNGSIELTREVLNNLDTQFPEWAGRGYEIVGFGWHQGYNDRINETFSAEYKNNMPDFITDVRKVLNKPNMPFVIATTGMAIGPAEPAPYTGYSEVEKAQLWVSGVAKPANVHSTDTRQFWRDPAQSPATSGQGFHWNHNAESYFLIGKSLGDNMVDLLTPP